MSRRYPQLQEFQVETKPRRRSFFQTTYPGETHEPGTIMGRTKSGWVKLLIFYAIFYTCLIALFSVCMATFLQHFINPRVPRLQQDYGLIGTSPGLGFRPLPEDVRSTLIWYKGTGYENYKYWEDQLKEFLSVYKQKGQTAGAGQNIYNCDYRNPPPPGKVCDVDIRGWEPCIEENHFSFHKSSPCIFLKLNRIYGWRPEFYDDMHNLPPEMPADLQRHIKNTTAFNRDYANTVWISCEGETPADKENIGPLEYLPHQGFPGYFYPYNNAEGYLSPLVAVHLKRPKRYQVEGILGDIKNVTQETKNPIASKSDDVNAPTLPITVPKKAAVVKPSVGQKTKAGIVINIECRAWARNINYSRKEKLGLVHFELMID